MLPASLIRISRAAAAILPAGLAAALSAFSPQSPLPVEAYAPAAESIRAEGLKSEGAIAILSRLLARAPHRLAGSPGYEEAARACLDEMRSFGLRTWTEPAPVERWTRGGTAEAVLSRPGSSGRMVLRIAALGLSVPTPAGGLEAPLVEVRSFEELEALGDRVRGTIVFFSHPMSRVPMETFAAYGEAAAYRTRGASEASRRGAVAVLVRSVTARLDGAPHGGMVGYDPAWPKIPAAAVATLDAEALSARLAESSGWRLRLRLDCRNDPPAEAPIVVGQWDGTDRSEEVVILGAHLDAWDLGQGAHDDGAGCAQAIEAVRLLKALGLHPKRSLRIVLYPNEEYGASAGRVYAASPRRQGERILAAMESDRGGLLPIGFGLGTGPAFEKLKGWEPLLRPSGIQWVGPGGGGSDVGPLAERGTVVMGFIPDSQRYFDYHHSANDVLAAVHPREIELGAVVEAIMAYVLAQEGI
ncbi:MAG: M20/M25/M40 family metallo-hydrolase [Candidatus Aminicenantes bacterium]|nr:M20/M25/M40 family metallo-hydrolase [Candidatus Aminicenantes bacterium]